MKMKKSRILALLLALMMCFALASCGGDKDKQDPATDGNKGNDVATLNLGFIGPITGPAALYGETAKRGAEMAKDEINAMEGGKLKIELNAQDDEHDAEKSVAAYNKLKDDKVQAIIGCVTTNPCLAVAEVANADRVFMMTPSASSPEVMKGKDNVYQLCFSDPTMGNESAQFIVDKKLATKVAIISNNADAYSTGIATAFKAKAAELGLTIVSETNFSDDTTDFKVQLKKAQDAGAELLFLPIYYTPASLIIKQAADMKYDVKFFGCDGMDGLLSIPGFDTKLAEGTMLLTPFNADAEDEATKDFVASYKEKYNEVPSQFAADGYDSVYAIYEAFKLTDKDVSAMSSEEVCQYLMDTFSSESFMFSGLTGKNMTWKKNGEVSKPTTVFEVKDGKYSPMS